MLVPDIHVLPILNVFIYGLLLEKNISLLYTSIYQQLNMLWGYLYLICYMEPRLRLKRKGT